MEDEWLRKWYEDRTGGIDEGEFTRNVRLLRVVNIRSPRKNPIDRTNYTYHGDCWENG